MYVENNAHVAQPSDNWTQFSVGEMHLSRLMGDILRFCIFFNYCKFVQVVEFVGQQNAAILAENVFENPGRSTCYRFQDNLVFPGIPWHSFRIKI